MIMRPSSGTAIARLPLSAALLVSALLAALGVSSCASGIGTPPPGGPPDTTAPQVVATMPVDGTLNFRGDEVSVEFSEYMQEGSMSSLVVITPIPSRTPEFDWSGRELTIAFQEPLLANRTYAITLAAGLTDLGSPGNRLGQPYTLRFSTGSTIDSGVVRGRVLGVERRRAFVFAYAIAPGAPDTLRPDSVRPEFIAPVADDGTFALEALPPGRLRLLAVTDEYGDQLFTPGIDALGIASADVTVDSAYTPVGGAIIRLAPAPADLTTPALYSARSLSVTSTELRFNEPIDTASIEPGRIVIESGGVAATIREVWRSSTNWLALVVAHEPLSGNQGSVRVTALRDTAGNVIVDTMGTATFALTGPLDTLGPSVALLSVDSVRAYSFPDSIAIGFDEAVRTGNLAGAVVLRDTLGRTLRFGLRRISAAGFLAYPIDTLAGASRGTLELDLGRFSDLDGNRRDSVARIRVAVGPVRQSGTISGTLVDTASPGAQHVVVAQLVGSTRTFRRTLRSGAWELAEVPEGEYRISAFRDDNGNGRYDYGGMNPFRAPEMLVEWEGTIRVRPRWATAKVDLRF